jgi:hypothetical protein
MPLIIIMEDEANEMCIDRPVRLFGCEPLRKQGNDSFRRMNVVSKDSINWFQAELRSKCVERWRQDPIDPELIHQPHQGALDELRYVTIHWQPALTAAVVDAAQHRWLEMNSR